MGSCTNHYHHHCKSRKKSIYSIIFNLLFPYNLLPCSLLIHCCTYTFHLNGTSMVCLYISILRLWRYLVQFFFSICSYSKSVFVFNFYSELNEVANKKWRIWFPSFSFMDIPRFKFLWRQQLFLLSLREKKSWTLPEKLLSLSGISMVQKWRINEHITGFFGFFYGRYSLQQRE